MKLKELCNVFIDGDWIESKDQASDGIRLIQTGNIGESCFLEKVGKEKYITIDTFKHLKCSEVLPGDILVSRLPDPVGRSCIVPFEKSHKKMITAVDCTICRVKEEIVDSEYVCYFMNSYNYYNQINNYITGTTRKRISRKNLGLIDIPIIDLERQKEIVIKLNTLKNIIRCKKEELEQLDILIKARFVEMFGDPQKNSLKFNKKMLKETCKIVTGNTPSRAVAKYYGEYIEWIKTDNIVQGLLNPTHAVEYLSREGVEVGRVVESNTILMACIAGSISSIGKVCITDRKVAFNQQINAVIPEQYNTLFLYVLLQISKSYLVSEINMALKGILSKSKLEEKEFIVPPIELQNQFAEFVKQVDKSKFAIQKSLEQTQLLFDSLMQKYFG